MKMIFTDLGEKHCEMCEKNENRVEFLLSPATV